MTIPRVKRLKIEPELPIVGLELKPNFLLRFPDGFTITADVLESAPVTDISLGYKWSRVRKNPHPTPCEVHKTQSAIVLSLTSRTYHCSSQCYQETENKKMKVWGKNDTMKIYDGKELDEIGNSKIYIPTTEDIGCVLELEISVMAGTILGPVSKSSTCRVVESPIPISRGLIPVSGVDVTGQPGSFTVLSYNILSDTSANSPLYTCCPPWARTWTYRRLKLLREIVGYGADVVCLQDVTNGHFFDFLQPELDKHGYRGCYLMRSNRVPGRKAETIDGCATFFKRDRFSLFLKSDFYFNMTAQNLVDAVNPSSQKPSASQRLIKDNVALIVGLEQKAADPSGKPQQICVTNTRLDVQQDLKDVMLWHVHTLLKKQEDIANRYKDIPMIMCGDFNMAPGSAPHSLLVTRKVDPSHQDLNNDPFGILQPQTKLAHQFPLVSAYTAFSRLPMVPGLDIHRTSIHYASNEPWFTVYNNDLKRCQDYIFYTEDNLRVESLMELVTQTEALPSLQWPSSHIALLAQFRCIPKTT